MTMKTANFCKHGNANALVVDGMDIIDNNIY